MYGCRKLLEDKLLIRVCVQITGFSGHSICILKVVGSVFFWDDTPRK
jgi:hypothetical protein